MNFEKAREYAKQKCKLIMAGKDVVKLEQAKRDLVTITKNKNIYVIIVDSSCKQSLSGLLESIMKTENTIDILINNDGFEITEMDLNFHKQELAKERLETHFHNFFYKLQSNTP